MNKRQVWRKMKRRDMPKGRRCVKCKWVFKEKRNGVFRARLVACGYSQVAGIDFSENYSPVVNDVSYQNFVNHLNNDEIAWDDCGRGDCVSSW